MRRNQENDLQAAVAPFMHMIEEVNDRYIQLRLDRASQSFSG